jgi:UDP-4-amino-4,6-dideoxy-N-acetyl-beta-L-altrosamine transaminase
MRKPIPYGRQSIDENDIRAVTDTLKSDFLTQGPQIGQFEDAFAKYIGVKYAVAVSNGTAALHLCALALNVKNGDKVITTPITFVASANCVKYAGGEVVFSDIDPSSYLIDINKIRTLLESSPKGTYKGIIPVDFAGRAVNLEECRKLADQYGLWIIEDACHAPGGYFIDNNGIRQNCGNGVFADLAVFSFHPVKHIACGEGGMITTNNDKLYKKLLKLRTHGITKNQDDLICNHGKWYYEMQELGFNYRLTDFQAALGLSQLRKADTGLIRRRNLAARYKKAFSGKKFLLGQSGDIPGHAYHLYVIEVERRADLFNYLHDNGIFVQVHYVPAHTMPYYKNQGPEISLPLAEKYYNHCMSLPMYPALTDEEQEYVIGKIIEFYS